MSETRMSSHCDKKHSKPTNNAARERSRVQSLRAAFLDLQRSLPSVPPDTKLSKLDILVLATGYIFHLTQTLEGTPDDQTRSQTKQSPKPTSFCNRTTSEDQHASIGFLTTDTNNALNPREKSSTFAFVDCNEVPETSRKLPKEHFYSKLMNDMSHQKAVSGSSRQSGAVHRLPSTSRMLEWKIPRQRREIRPRILINQNSSVGILHPVKKWPMRCRLYDKILGHEPVPPSLQSWKREERDSI